MRVKQQPYTNEEIEEFRVNYEAILAQLKDGKYEDYLLPKLSISGKVFQKDAEKAMMSCKVKINKVVNLKARDLLFLGWLACVEELSDYRKAGNGLKKEKL